jgi:hypothetical protein
MLPSVATWAAAGATITRENKLASVAIMSLFILFIAVTLTLL